MAGANSMAPLTATLLTQPEGVTNSLLRHYFDNCPIHGVLDDYNTLMIYPAFFKHAKDPAT